MMENMEHYDALKTPPPDALKPIAFGPLKGKSDISPQWRYEKMTEHFGPCGIGWGYSVDERWTEQGPNETVACFVRISLWYDTDNDGLKSDTIPAHGGSMLVIKDKNGLHISDEAYKMATTDALGNAMKKIGLAADVYRGLVDSKYNQPQQQQPAVNAKPLFDQHSQAMDDQFREWCIGAMANGAHGEVIKEIQRRFK